MSAWDMISVNFGPPISLNRAAAIASDGSTITMTGSGTFVAPASGRSSSAVTGGGAWTMLFAAIVKNCDPLSEADPMSRHDP